ncbi:MAG TPA: hypothetical protein VGE88_11055 [Lysobacter sp.]
MGASSAGKFSFKRRDELDTLIDTFEQDLSARIDDLVAYVNGYADTILSVTGADDDQYVCTRINGILKERGLRFDALESQGT